MEIQKGRSDLVQKLFSRRTFAASGTASHQMDLHISATRWQLNQETVAGQFEDNLTLYAWVRCQFQAKRMVTEAL